MPYKLDTDTEVRFYEQEFYVLSNFSSFAIYWGWDRNRYMYMTSEAAYHSEKFISPTLKAHIRNAASAHEAFKIAQAWKDKVRSDWYEPTVRVPIMHRILWTKVCQHEYVWRKLHETGDRLLLEDSWRDDFWGTGPNMDGENYLGRLWMTVRKYLPAKYDPNFSFSTYLIENENDVYLHVNFQ